MRFDGKIEGLSPAAPQTPVREHPSGSRAFVLRKAEYCGFNVTVMPRRTIGAAVSLCLERVFVAI